MHCSPSPGGDGELMALLLVVRLSYTVYDSNTLKSDKVGETSQQWNQLFIVYMRLLFL